MIRSKQNWILYLNIKQVAGGGYFCYSWIREAWRVIVGAASDSSLRQNEGALYQNNAGLLHYDVDRSSSKAPDESSLLLCVPQTSTVLILPIL